MIDRSEILGVLLCMALVCDRCDGIRKVRP